MIKAVIFDFDDTLCLTEEACWHLENETLATMGRSPIPRELHLKTWGKPLFEEAIGLRSPGVDVDAFRRAFTPKIKEAINSGRLDTIPEANFKALDELIAKGKAVVILTSREHSELEHILEPDHELASRVEAFYYKDNMQFHKPDPRAFEHIEREHGWLPEECVYVGDSLSDAQAAKGARMHFVASLESGLRTREEFLDQDKYPVDAFINTLPEITSVIDRLDAS